MMLKPRGKNNFVRWHISGWVGSGCGVDNMLLKLLHWISESLAAKCFEANLRAAAASLSIIANGARKSCANKSWMVSWKMNCNGMDKAGAWSTKQGWMHSFIFVDSLGSLYPWPRKTFCCADVYKLIFYFAKCFEQQQLKKKQFFIKKLFSPFSSFFPWIMPSEGWNFWRLFVPPPPGESPQRWVNKKVFSAVSIRQSFGANWSLNGSRCFNAILKGACLRFRLECSTRRQ